MYEMLIILERVLLQSLITQHLTTTTEESHKQSVLKVRAFADAELITVISGLLHCNDCYFLFGRCI